MKEKQTERERERERQRVFRVKVDGEIEENSRIILYALNSSNFLSPSLSAGC